MERGLSKCVKIFDKKVIKIQIIWLKSKILINEENKAYY